MMDPYWTNRHRDPEACSVQNGVGRICHSEWYLSHSVPIYAAERTLRSVYKVTCKEIDFDYSWLSP